MKEDAEAFVPAREADLPEVAALMNRAYRGVEAEAGWSSEARLLGGSRTDVAMLRADLAAKPEAALMLRREHGLLVGSVWLEPVDGATWYLGGLTVEPGRQAQGLGRRLLAQAEALVRARGGTTIRMTVIQLRDTLIAWYARRGYHPTGETAPFPYGDTRFGVPLRPDLYFMVLAKRLPPSA